MIRAKAADGSIHNFPDGTPDAVVDKAMREYTQRSTPGYAKARERLKAEDARSKPPAGLPDITGFGRRVAGTTGAADDVGGAVRFGLQGVENIYRRVTGQPIETTAGQAYLAAADSENEWQDKFVKEHPVQNVFANVAGIAATGRPTGAVAIRNPFRAGAAVAAQNLPFAYTRQEGTVGERLPGTVAETAVAFGTGSALTAGGNYVGRRAAAARARPPSPQRQLSQQGVNLTPGQMAGGVVQRTEDALTSLPVVGDSIRAAQIRGLDDFGRAGANRILAPIGATLGPNVRGREVVGEAERAISNHYRQALQNVTVAPDQQYAQELAQIAATPNLTAAQREQLTAVLGDHNGRFAGPIAGDAWKVLDADIGKALRASENASQQAPGGRALTAALERLKQAHDALLQRTSPQAFNAVQQADEATAGLVRIRQASQYAGTAARGGSFSPGDLNRAVQATDTSAGNRAYARGDAMLQDLSDPAMEVLPKTVPDSGTPLRSLFTAGAGGVGLASLGTSPEALAVAGGAAVGTATAYSRPAIAALNAVYRASTPGQARQALAQLAQLAARDPALVPAYTEAARALGVPLAGNGGRPAPQ